MSIGDPGHVCSYLFQLRLILPEEKRGFSCPTIALLVLFPANIPALDLVDYSSSSNSDPSKDSLPPAPDLPLVSPFLCFDDLEADDLHGDVYLNIHRIVILHQIHLLLVHLQIIPYPDIHRQIPSMLIHLHHRDLFIDHLLGLHDVVRLLDVRAPTPADLLPPRKRFRDSYSPEDSGEEHMEVDTANANAVADVGISEGVVAHPEDGVGMGVEIAASDVREDDEEFEAEASAADTREIAVDPLAIVDSSESSRGGIYDHELLFYELAHNIVHRTMTITRSGMTPEAIEELVNRHVEEVLAAHEAARAANALEAENQSQNGSDDDNGNGENGNGENGNGGNGNPNENGRGDRLVARECTYQDFMKCQPLNFKGTKGVVGLIRWFEKMEIVFHISNCPEKYQVKYATCTLLNSALTWWNSHKRTVGTEAAFAMSWRELMKLMAEVYCPRNEIQKMESELWNLTVKNNDLAAYTQRFQELTMMCTKMVPEEEDQTPRCCSYCQQFNGSKVEGNVGGQNVARAYTASNNEKRGYVGPLPYCNKCKLHHEGPCTVKCGKCNKVGHMARDCKNAVAVPATQRAPVVNQRVPTCFECGRQ
ncbi:putative reverse transcriptase domain-containing protein [Tanacetum coccineum]